MRRTFLVLLGLWLGSFLFVGTASAQTACSIVSQTTLLNDFSDNAPTHGITPRMVRDFICSIYAGGQTIIAGTGLTGGGSGTSITVSLANMAANTWKGNPTGSNAAPTDNTWPSCPDTGSNHLSYVNGTGPTCGTSNPISISPAQGIATSNIGGQSAITTTGSLFLDCSFLPMFMGGLQTSNDVTTPNTVIDTASGAACSDDSTTLMKIAPFTKTTAAWALGAGNGCLDTGSVANSTWYHLYVIERTDTSVVDELCSTSVTPTFPTSYTKKRRIGSFKTDGSGHILAFTQLGTIFYWSTATLDINTSTLSTSAALQTLNVPPNVKVQPICRWSATNASFPFGIILTSPDETDVAPTSAAPFAASPGADETGITDGAGYIAGTCPLLTVNTAQQIRARASEASTTLQIVTRGWVD